MSINVNDKNLGHATAYAYYKAGGGTMTEAEFTEFMADFGTASQTAVEAAQAALASETAAQTAATTATNKASEATTAATTATTKAGEASTSASTATSAKDTAVSASQTATSKATEATTAAATATSAATTATTAKDDAVSAKTAAQTAQAGAETAAASVSASAAQIATNTDDITQLKSKFTALESDGVAPSAEQILTDKGITDSVPYHYRKTGGDGADRLYDQIVGGTVRWNQLVNNMRSSSTTNGLTFVNNNGALTISGTVTEAFDYNTIMLTNNTVKFKRDGSKYFVMLNKEIPFAWGVGGYGNVIPVGNRAWIWTNNSGGVWTNGLTFKAEVGQTVDVRELKASIFDLTAMFGSAVADYIYQLEQTTAGAGVAFFKALFPNDYYPYNAGELVSVSGLSEHKMVGFNKFDKSTVLNGYIINDATGDIMPVSAGKVTDYISVIPNQTYCINSDQASGGWGAWYDADKNYISSITGYVKDGGNVNKLHTAPSGARYMRLTCFYNNSGDLNTFCVNISDPTKNGTYEPYKAHSYPLDSTLTLRGLFKLDANNNLYADGDTYDADGTVTRKYGIVDLGTLIWTKSTDYANPIFYASISDIISGVQDKKLVCSKYDYVVGLSAGTVANYTTPVIGAPTTNTQVIVRDPNYDSSDAATFKAAMSGVMLVYRLATHTTEQADPYQHLQQCDPNGTEEYVSTGIVPIGHNSFYPENLRAKVEQLPWNFASLIAPTESAFVATRNYTTGALLIVNNVLYKTTANIANGGTITPNTNVTATTLAEVIAALS